MNMPEFGWMCLCKYDSEYTSGLKYAKLLNVAKFWIWKGSQYASVTQRAGECFDKVLKISWVAWILNVPLLWICRSCAGFWALNMPQYDWTCLNRTWTCLNMFEFTIIDRILNIYYAVHGMRSLYKLMSTYWEISGFRTWSKM